MQTWRCFKVCDSPLGPVPYQLRGNESEKKKKWSPKSNVTTEVLATSQLIHFDSHFCVGQEKIKFQCRFCATHIILTNFNFGAGVGVDAGSLCSSVSSLEKY